MKNKAWLPHLMFTKSCPLTLTDRLVYSHLVYRRRKNRGATQDRVSKTLSLNAALVKRSLAALSVCHLVTRAGKAWRAEQPTGEQLEWFVTKARKGDWWAQFRAFAYYLPSSQCGMRSNIRRVVYSKCLSMCKETMSYNGLSVLIGESPRTIQRSVTWLVRAGLFEVTFRRGKVFRLKPLAAPENWFREKTLPEKTQQEKTQQAPTEATLVNVQPSRQPPITDERRIKLQFYNQFIGMRLTPNQAANVASWVMTKCSDDTDLIPVNVAYSLQEEAMAENREHGNRPDDYGSLFWWKLLAWMQKHRGLRQDKFDTLRYYK